jgi:hypothetical protein
MIKQWVESVVCYSSELDSKGWSADNLIGIPTVFPNYGHFTFFFFIFLNFFRTSWSPLESRGKEEFLEVKFKEKLYLKKLKIFETNCPVWFLFFS